MIMQLLTKLNESILFFQLFQTRKIRLIHSIILTKQDYLARLAEAETDCSPYFLLIEMC